MAETLNLGDRPAGGRQGPHQRGQEAAFAGFDDLAEACEGREFGLPHGSARSLRNCVMDADCRDRLGPRSLECRSEIRVDLGQARLQVESLRDEFHPLRMRPALRIESARNDQMIGCARQCDVQHAERLGFVLALLDVSMHLDREVPRLIRSRGGRR